MLGDERNDEARDSSDILDRARWERSNAAWRPFEDEWAARVTAKYDALRAVRENKFRRGTPAEADAVADLADLYTEMAREAARTAQEKDFESRWGYRVMERVLDGDDLCVLFNNSLYDLKPIRRDQELEELRGWIKAQEYTVGELAYAEYPERGADEGYTYSLLLACDPAWSDDVEEQFEAMRMKSLSDLSELKDSGKATSWDV